MNINEIKNQIVVLYYEAEKCKTSAIRYMMKRFETENEEEQDRYYDIETEYNEKVDEIEEKIEKLAQEYGIDEEQLMFLADVADGVREM